jgi:hypothetical protein
MPIAMQKTASPIHPSQFDQRPETPNWMPGPLTAAEVVQFSDTAFRQIFT